MRLDFEIKGTETFLPDNDFAGATELVGISRNVSQKLAAGIEAARQGNRAEARALLFQVAETEPENENAWLWLASTSEYPEELLGFLDKVLSLNPKNERALEQIKETKSLLAKSFVERGIAASEENRKAFAEQCFWQAISYDDENETALEQLAYLNDSEDKTKSPPENVFNLDAADSYEITPVESESSVYVIEDDEIFSLDEVSQQDYLQKIEEAAAPEFYNKNHAAEEGEEFFAHDELDEKESEKSSGKFVPKTFVCPFCSRENEPQEFVCPSCRAMLSLSDLEMLLAHADANQEIVRQAVERMETENNLRGFDARELKILGIGQMNLKHFRQGFAYLQQAAQSNPNDVVLGAQVNALAIRLAEIEEQETVHSAMSKNKTILVVDDSATVRHLIAGKLEKIGHEVLCAIDGVDALEKIESVVPDLILLDIAMPRMDGYQVCKLIRSNEKTKDVPVVMISGKDGFFDKVRGRMAGTTGYITKPFGPETLMKTVESYFV